MSGIPVKPVLRASLGAVFVVISATLIWLFLLDALLASSLGTSNSRATHIDSHDLGKCVSDTAARVTPDKVELEVLREVVAHCYSLLRSQQLLGDYAIRRQTFGQQ